jgi:hypothetical protein
MNLIQENAKKDRDFSGNPIILVFNSSPAFHIFANQEPLESQLVLNKHITYMC